MDNLQKIFRDNTPAELDLPEGHRNRFEKRLNQEFHQKSMYLRAGFYLAVASLVLLLMIVTLKNNPVQNIGLILTSTDSETVESENYLQSQIASRMFIIDSIKSIKTDNMALVNDIDDIDSSLTRLKIDLKESPNDLRIINAVINTYRIKIEALDNIILILQKYS
jgi:hypothetical protein